MLSSDSKKAKKRRVMVRTGCVVCKARRVKCDERKPTCLRCEKAGKICEGYKNPTKTDQPTSEKRTLVQRAADRSGFGRFITSSSTSLLSQPPPLSKSLFENEHQRRYFNNFRTKTAQQLFGCAGSSLWWDTIVPQTCEREPSILRIVTALGALGFTSDSQKLIQSSPLDLLDVSEHHAFALREYGKAIKILREQSSKGNVDLRTAIMFCIACIGFEAFHGNFESALAQLHSGINLLHEAILENGGDTNDFILGTSVIPSIESELVLALRLLGCPGETFPETTDSQTISYHEERYDIFQQAIDEMPPVFLEYGEAHHYHELLTKRSWHYLTKLVQYDFEFHWSATPTLGLRIFDPIVHPLSCIPSSIFEEHERHVSGHKRWAEAFAPLYHSRTEAGKSDFVLATTIKIQTLTGKIIVDNALSLLQTSYDAYLDTFSEVVTLTMDLLSHPDHYTKKGCFTLHCQYIPPIFFCALKCRFQPIRKQAMSILLSSPRREGQWDSTIAAELLEWVIGVEEEGMDVDGYIPETARARAVKAEVDMPSRKARVSCQVPWYDGELEFKEARITW